MKPEHGGVTLQWEKQPSNRLDIYINQYIILESKLKCITLLGVRIREVNYDPHECFHQIYQPDQVLTGTVSLGQCFSSWSRSVSVISLFGMPLLTNASSWLEHCLDNVGPLLEVLQEYETILSLDNCSYLSQIITHWFYRLSFRKQPYF